MAVTATRRWKQALLSCSFLISLAIADCSGGSIVNEAQLQTFIRNVSTACDGTISGTVSVSNVAISPSPSLGRQASLDLSSLATVGGSLSIDSVHVDESDDPWALNLSQLNNVGETLSLTNLEHLQLSSSDMSNISNLNALAFRSVTFADTTPAVDESLLPKLYGATSLVFANTNLNRIGPFSKSLSIYDAAEQTSTQLTVVGNTDLTSLDFSGYAGYMTYVDIQGENKLLRVNLREITVATINISDVLALSAEDLQTLGNSTVPDTIQVISDNGFSELSLPALTSAVGTLVIENNEDLNDLDLSKLATVSTLKIIGNPSLSEINLPALQTILVSLEIEGPVDTINVLGLQNAEAFSIKTYGSFDCSSLTLSDVRTCNTISPPTRTAEPSQSAGPHGSDATNGEHDNTSGAASGGGGLSTGAKIGIGVGVGVSVLAIAAVVLFFWCCARRNKKRSPRSAGAGEYYMSDAKGTDRSPARYTKVANSGSIDHGSVDHSSEERISPSSRFGENWSPPEQRVPTTDGRMELEEQQGMRHEMDARSLQDMDLDDDREETRSLEDIERAHGHR